MPECAKKGCRRPAEIEVVLNDPDGDVHWLACVPHAEAFHQFVKEESERSGSAWSAVFTGISGDTAVIAVDGSD